eukprot:248823-Chlamydomonas_euryale.AAC.1
MVGYRERTHFGYACVKAVGSGGGPRRRSVSGKQASAPFRAACGARRCAFCRARVGDMPRVGRSGTRDHAHASAAPWPPVAPAATLPSRSACCAGSSIKASMAPAVRPASLSVPPCPGSTTRRGYCITRRYAPRASPPPPTESAKSKSSCAGSDSRTRRVARVPSGSRSTHDAVASPGSPAAAASAALAAG